MNISGYQLGCEGKKRVCFYRNQFELGNLDCCQGHAAPRFSGELAQTFDVAKNMV
jgi:hypothetical protein